MKLLLSYTWRNAFRRRLTSLLTIVGIGLVVFVFCAVLMLSNGLTQALVDTGSPNNAIVLREAASTEVTSIVRLAQGDVVSTDPAIALNDDGAPMIAGELMILIYQAKRGQTKQANVNVRGIDEEMSLAIRPQVKLVEGRMFRPGTSEIIAGAKVAKNFENCDIGESIRFGQRDWEVVGIFEANGSGFESELWTDYQQLADAFQRPIYSSLTFRLTADASMTAVEERLENDPRLTVDVMPEIEYYRKQSQAFSTFIEVLGTVISIVFSLGAIVGAMITMYAAVSNRTREIGTLRAIGFSRPTVLGAFLVESLVIATAGGVIGIVFANLLSFKEISTTNFATFAEVAFSFVMSPEIAMKAFIFAIVMGFVGGFLPAVRASRLKVINALNAK